MLKLAKYEFRRNIIGIGVMLAAILGLQGYFLGAAYMGKTEQVVIAAALLAVVAWIAVVMVLVYSVNLYAKELNAKSSYLTFMTPNSSARILGAKLLSTLVLGAVFALLLGAFAVWDFAIVRARFPEIEFMQVMINTLLAQVNSNLTTLLLVVGSVIFSFLVNFFTTVVVAYLAITLSATALQNKRFKGLVSTILFLAIMVAMGWLLQLLPASYDYVTVGEMMLQSLPATLISLGFAVAAFLLSARLLTRRVSL